MVGGRQREAAPDGTELSRSGYEGRNCGNAGLREFAAIPLTSDIPEGIEKWTMWSVDVRKVYLRALVGETPHSRRRICKRRAPANGFNDAPVAIRNTAKVFVERQKPLTCAGPKFKASSFDSCLYFMRRMDGGALGA